MPYFQKCPKPKNFTVRYLFCLSKVRFCSKAVYRLSAAFFTKIWCSHISFSAKQLLFRSAPMHSTTADTAKTPLWPHQNRGNILQAAFRFIQPTQISQNKSARPMFPPHTDLCADVLSISSMFMKSSASQIKKAAKPNWKKQRKIFSKTKHSAIPP